MVEVLTGVNGDVIRWARKFYNMTPEDAATSIGVDLPQYLQWESGAEYPTYAKLKEISRVFRKPSAIFFFPEPPCLPAIKGDLRTLPNAVVDCFSKNVIVQFEKAKAYQIGLEELYGKKASIIAQRDTFPADLEQLGRYFRAKLEFPLSAQKARKNEKVVFEIFRDKFYDLGIYVFKDAFKDNSISGLCINDDFFPVIMINNSMSFARQTFTLFHELYHLISNTSGAEIIRDDYYTELNNQQKAVERDCDSFANAFLIPVDDFKQELAKKPLTEDRISELAQLYSVSKEAVMYKLYKMALISSADYNALKETFYGDAIRSKGDASGRQTKGNHYNTKLSYLGQRYVGDVFKLYFSGKIDNVRTSEMLQSKIDHLPKLETVYFRGVSR